MLFISEYPGTQSVILASLAVVSLLFETVEHTAQDFCKLQTNLCILKVYVLSLLACHRSINKAPLYIFLISYICSLCMITLKSIHSCQFHAISIFLERLFYFSFILNDFLPQGVG